MVPALIAEEMNTRLLLITPAFPPEEGGIQRYLHNICVHLPPGTIRVLTIALDSSDWASFDASQPFPVQRVRYTPHLTPISLAVKLVAQGIHASAILWGTLALAAVIGPFVSPIIGRDVPWILVTYGKDLMEHRRWSVMYLLEQMALRRANSVVAISRFTTKCLMNRGVEPDRIRLIYPTASRQFLAPPTSADRLADLQRRYHLGRCRPIILSVGRLVQRKGHEQVIEAMSTLRREFPQAIYLIGGRGPYQKQLERKVRRLGLEQCVRFLGFIPEHELIPLYDLADLFVLPARDEDGDVEGFGIVFLEAQTRGVPVIGGRSGGVQDAVRHGETGLLVDPEDVQGIAQAMLKILCNPAWARQLGEAGRQWVEREFEPSIPAHRIQDMIRTMKTS